VVQSAIISDATAFSFSRFVEHIRIDVPDPARAHSVEWLPDGRTTLVFRAREEGRRGDISVLGPRMRALFKDVTGVARIVCVQFKPGWAASLLGVSAHALTDRIVSLEDVWGSAAGDLRDDLLTASTPADVLARLTRAFGARSLHASESASARLSRRAARLLEGDEMQVKSVAERLGVSARHLRRAFTESVGIGPKEFARAARLQRAIATATTTSNDWGQIAADAGYYDQAHLIGDFRELVGLTPSAFLKRTEGRASASKACAAA
jgi:AraC-like DNA-binding protein